MISSMHSNPANSMKAGKIIAGINNPFLFALIVIFISFS